MSSSGSLVGVVVKNYYEGEEVKSDTVLRTSKRDKFYHGYGVKSMKNIAEKYGGSFAVNTNDNEFVVSILMNGLVK